MYRSRKVFVDERRPLSDSSVKRRLDFGESLPEVLESAAGKSLLKFDTTSIISIILDPNS